MQELGWKRSDYVLSTKIFWGGKGVNDKGLSRKHIIEGMKVSRPKSPYPQIHPIYLSSAYGLRMCPAHAFCMHWPLLLCWQACCQRVAPGQALAAA